MSAVVLGDARATAPTRRGGINTAVSSDHRNSGPGQHKNFGLEQRANEQVVVVCSIPLRVGNKLDFCLCTNPIEGELLLLA
jgi:hypothetical protein